MFNISVLPVVLSRSASQLFSKYSYLLSLQFGTRSSLQIQQDGILSWKIHIDNTATKISRTVGLIAKLRHFVSQHTLLNIYRALILPYLSYGLIVWGQASKTHLTKILLLQKKVIRFIFFANRKVHAIPLFIDANILPISFLYFKSLSYVMHDIHTNTAPSKIVNVF